MTARIRGRGDLYRGSTVVRAVPDGVADADPIIVELVVPSGAPPTTVQGSLATRSGQPVDAVDLIVITEMDAYPATAPEGSTRRRHTQRRGVSRSWPPPSSTAELASATAPESPAPGDVTAVEPILFDDTFGAFGGGQKRRQGTIRSEARLPGSRGEVRAGLLARGIVADG